MATPPSYEHCLSAGLDPKTPILLAVSGGPDSMAMAHFIHHWRQNHPFAKRFLRAVIIDHGLRSSSSAEADLACKRLMDWGISAAVKRISSPPPQSGIQAWARRHRYGLLWQDAATDGAVIVLGHHRDDQAETVQMRLSRGSGLEGLRGMERRSFYKGIVLCRPFLGLSKQDLLAYAKAQGIDFITDPSNSQRRFERGRLRTCAADFKRLNLTHGHFLRLSESAGRISDGVLNQLCAYGGFGINRGGWGWIDLDIWPRPDRHLLRFMAASLAAADYPPNAPSLERLSVWAASGTSPITTLGGLEWHRKAGRLWVYPEAEKPIKPQAVSQGHHLIDGRWHLYTQVAGTVLPLGDRGFAALRRLTDLPPNTPPNTPPARAYWRWPTFKPSRETNINSLNDLITLEDGVMIPHLEDRDMIHREVHTDNKAALTARFVGGNDPRY